MNILFLTTVLLSRKCNGGEVASQNLIDALRHNGHHVVVVGYLRKGDSLAFGAEGATIVAERVTETNNARLLSFLWLLLSIIKASSYSSTKYYSAAYHKHVVQLLQSRQFDGIIIDHAQLSWLRHIAKGAGFTITVAHNIEHQNYSEHSINASNPFLRRLYEREARLIKVEEHALVGAADEVWVFTEHDAKYFSSINHKVKTRVLALAPNYSSLLDGPIANEFDIGLLGSWSWQANREAIRWFLERVYPLIPPNLSIHIAGKGLDSEIQARSNIYYHGVVSNAQTFMAQARVIAIPTLGGGGIQIKTLDAIASGSAIVATPAALRGLSAVPTTVRVAQKPKDFADLLISLTQSPLGEGAFHEARAWYTARRQRLICDIGFAIQHLRN